MTITWQNNIPTSQVYNDIYYSQENGLEETQHVFLDGNNLPERWQSLKENFHIIETGFGTGLNFFAAWKFWKERTSGAKLYFTSIEKHPLKLSDIRKAISCWPEFAVYLDEFATQYPEDPAFQNDEIGKNILILDNGNVQLTLLWGDVNEVLPSINQQADAWFPDGFAPAKNPDMWNDNLYKEMARLTAIGGTFATFTAVGNVRRGLQQNGFVVSKVPGFGKKRHILVGIKNFA